MHNPSSEELLELDSVQESLLDVAEEPVLGSLAGAVRRVPLARCKQ